MSCRQRRQSNEIDSVKRATSAAGPPAKRPLRDTGEPVFMLDKPGRNVGGNRFKVTEKSPNSASQCPPRLKLQRGRGHLQIGRDDLRHGTLAQQCTGLQWLFLWFKPF